MIANEKDTASFIAGLWGKYPTTVIEAPMAGGKGTSYDGLTGTVVRTPETIAVADGAYVFGAQLRSVYFSRRSGKRPERCVISLEEQILGCRQVSRRLVADAAAAERESGDRRFHAVWIAAERALDRDAFGAGYTRDCLGHPEIETYPESDRACILEILEKTGRSWSAFSSDSWLLDPLRDYVPGDVRYALNLGADRGAVDAFLSEIRCTLVGKPKLRDFSARKLSVLACLDRIREQSPGGKTPGGLPLPEDLRPAVRELVGVHRNPRYITALEWRRELYGPDRRMPDPDIQAWAEQS